MKRGELDKIMKEYFYSWRPYKLIIARLEEVDGIKKAFLLLFSVSWLKRQYKRLLLSRRPLVYADKYLVLNCIKKELRCSSRTIGYRAMWMIIRNKYQLVVRRKTVMELMRVVDAQGVHMRSNRRFSRRNYHSKGPNYVWHMDGYDKLTPFGFCIHGCVDGFSRKVIWLRVGSTNNDPRVVLKYYLEAVEEAQGCPCFIRMDRGTENGCVAAAQYAFRAMFAGNETAERSFLYGRSPSNVKIEEFWSQLRRNMTEWWIDALKELQHQGLYSNCDSVHRMCLAVVCLPLIEDQLKAFCSYWNSHRVRKSSIAINGIPNDLYDMPTYYGTANYLRPVDGLLWAEAMSESNEAPPLFTEPFFERCVNLVKNRFGIDLCRDICTDNFLSVYMYLISVLR